MWIKGLLLALVMAFSFVAISPSAQAATTCNPKATFFGIPSWYQYLPLKVENNSCVIDTSNVQGSVAVLIILAVIDILLRLSAIAAVVFVVYGGFMFVISQGDPQKIVSSRKIIVNAIVGLVIAILASQIVKFTAKFLSQ